LERLINRIFPVDEAANAYESLQQTKDRPLIVLLAYPQAAQSVNKYRISHPYHRASGREKVRLAIIGASGFNAGMHIPNLKALGDLYSLEVVMSRTGHHAAALAKSLSARYSTTDYQEVLHDPDIDAVLIGTRHNTHAEMTLQALRAGKHVLVEKPLGLTRQELEAIKAFYAEEIPHPQLLTGFNRRFSPHAQRIKAIVQGRVYPMILRYRMNAGYIPLNHWIQTAEGGGRNLGEACHIYDLFTYLTDSEVVKIEAQAIRIKPGHYTSTDNFVVTLTFAEGSVATLTYTALGAKGYPKEHLEVYVDGKVLELDDYTATRVYGAAAKGLETKETDKGHRREVELFAKSILQGGDWIIPLWQQIQATEIALQVDEIIRSSEAKG
jgi:predicted dehydrogenase